MEALVGKMASFFVRQGAICESDRDIYSYGLTEMLSTLVNLTLTIFVGWMFGVLWQTVIFFLPFAVLRASAGGHHAKTFWGCVLGSSIIIIVVIASISFVSASSHFLIAIPLLMISIVTVFVLAPVKHPNRPFSPNERHKFRTRARITVIVGTVLSISLYWIQEGAFSFCIALGLTAASAMLLPEIKRRRGDKG